MNKLSLFSILFLFGALLFSSCNDDDTVTYYPITNTDEETVDTTAFAKGADVSWVTEMESNDVKFYNADGEETECMSLLKSLGMNAIRLRVWVDPTDGWCNKTDFLIKAKRASDLKMRIMVDFHYSDSWADPGKQNKPDAWTDYTLTELIAAVEEHTSNVLNSLKDWGITPTWVQIGNETTYGMLWDDDESISGYLTANNGANYTQLHNAGYDVVKSIFPNAKVILHIDRGNRGDLTKNLLTITKANNIKIGVLGFSLYPETDDWESLTTLCIANMQWVVDYYDLDVMICEVGMSSDAPDTTYQFLSELISKVGSITDNNGDTRGLGVFYWEPECYYGWNGYAKGAFDETGKPTKALDAFSE